MSKFADGTCSIYNVALTYRILSIFLFETIYIVWYPVSIVEISHDLTKMRSFISVYVIYYCKGV